MKKIMATLLAMVLVLAMCVPAMAETMGSLTINNAYDGKQFAIYKMLGLEVGTDGSHKYTIDSDWATFYAGYLQEDKPVGEDDLIVPVLVGDKVKYIVIDDIANFAAKAADQADSMTNDGTATAANHVAAFSNLDHGYYLVLTVGDAAAAPFIVNVDGNEERNEKNAYPQIYKNVDNDGKWAEENDASIGDEVNFQIRVYISAIGDDYVIHDELEAGFTFKEIKSVKLGNENLGYTLKTSELKCESGCTFEVSLTKPESGWVEGSEVIVAYSAILGAKATTGTDSNDNEAWLTYTESDAPQSLIPVDTATYTYEFDLVKTDSADKLLDGAKFKLYNAATGGNEIPVVFEEGGYRLAVSGETGAEIVVTNGKVTISGLDAGTYYLEETAAPAGYNMLTARVQVDISGNNTAIVDGTVYSKGGVQVINQTGSALPETGGIGTTVFYVVGGLLMAAAVVLLVAKKKVSGNK